MFLTKALLCKPVLLSSIAVLSPFSIDHEVDGAVLKRPRFHKASTLLFLGSATGVRSAERFNRLFDRFDRRP